MNEMECVSNLKIAFLPKLHIKRILEIKNQNNI